MQNPIDTRQINGSKSTFIVDLMKVDTGKLFVQVHQSINSTTEKLPSIKISSNN